MERNFKHLCVALGKAVSAKRKLLKLSQEELAFRADIDRTYISQIERGVSNPSLLVISKVAHVLELPLSQLFSQL